MSTTAVFVILILLSIVIGVPSYRRQQTIKRSIESRLALIESQYENIQKANAGYQRLTSNAKGYFTHKKASRWKTSCKDLYEKIGEVVHEDLPLKPEAMIQIRRFKEVFQNLESKRKEVNRAYITNELAKYNKFFDNVEGRKLDAQQRTAIVTDEDNNLVIAGAGSGKTTTIVGKVKYVIDRYKVDPSQILLITFTKDSAKTLTNRIDVEGLSAQTFHSFGKRIVDSVSGVKTSVYDQDQFRKFLRDEFEELQKNDDYLQKVTNYFIYFLKPPKSQLDFASLEEHVSYLRDYNFRAYREVALADDKKTTWKQERVKSTEECMIANFLIFNGVEYKYEEPYPHQIATPDFSQYKPDFTIKSGGKTIFLEHFGVAKNGQVPDWFDPMGNPTATNKYQAGIKWKRELHKKQKTVLIETYSYEMKERTLLRNLKDKLEAAGVVVKPKSKDEIWKIIKDVAPDEVDGIIELFATFITLMKSNNYTVPEVRERNETTGDTLLKERNSIFLDLIEPLISSYQCLLNGRNEIDFSDMINHAAHLIRKNKYQAKFKYVIIDEFQDISIGRFRLVQAVLQQNPECKTFCVGDDWQSIYRFTGSDISLFRYFEKHFGYTEKSKIETTYRFGNPVIETTSGFIMKNPFQESKSLKSKDANKATNYGISSTVNQKYDSTEALLLALKDLVASDHFADKRDVLLLGRYNFDLKRYKSIPKLLKIDLNNKRITYYFQNGSGKQQLEMRFLSAHRAKGLEADVVILLNSFTGKYGLPSGMADDKVLNMLLSEGDDYEHGEERRLFYVAMTRARHMTYVITNAYDKSPFIGEIEATEEENTRKCPRCQIGDLVPKASGITKNGDSYVFYGCTNYKFGCSHSATDFAKGDGSGNQEMKIRAILRKTEMLPITLEKQWNTKYE